MPEDIDAGVDPVEDKTSPDSSTENKEDGTTHDIDENKKDETIVPFHEDPKVQDYINRQVESKKGEWLSEAETKISERFAPKEQTKVPPWFGGGDSSNPELVSQYESFQEDIATMSEERARQAVEEYKSEQDKQTSLVEEATRYFDESIESIEKSTGKRLAESDRNELMKFVYDNELIDGKGRWNYSKGYEFMNAVKTKEPSDLEERKRLAALANSDNKAETSPKDFKTSDDFKGGNRPW